jgi:hypothetical protein
MKNTISLQLQQPDGGIHEVTLIGRYDDLKNYGAESSIVYSVWFADDTPGGYFSFSAAEQDWEYYGYLTPYEQAQISDFLQENREIKWA